MNKKRNRNKSHESVVLYTDGSCKSDLKGGYAAYIPSQEVVVCGAQQTATNNQMELKAVIDGLQYIKNDSNVVVHSDSRYVCDGIEKGWLASWEKNNWRTLAGSRVKNKELWQRLKQEIDNKKKVDFVWVKGHSSTYGNNLCDTFASGIIECLEDNK